MLRLTRKQDALPVPGAAIRAAQVCEIGEDSLCRVASGSQHDRQFAWAALAVVGDYVPRIGDRVLVAGEGNDECYVIGVLKTGPASVHVASSPTEGEHLGFETAAGASARVAYDDTGEQIEVRDNNDQLVFAYDVETGRATLNVAKGDLALSAPEGFVDLVAGRGIRAFSPGAVRVESGSGVTLKVQGSEGSRSAGVQLAQSGTAITGETLGVAASQGDFRIDDARYTGTRLTSVIEGAKISFTKLETVVGRLIARAKDVYRKVEGIEQVEAGQLRTKVKGVHTVEAQASYHRTKGDVKIDGSHIHLG